MRSNTRTRADSTRRVESMSGGEAADATSQAASLQERLRRAYVAHALADALPRRRRWAVKRALDLTIALPLMLITAPLWLLVALRLRVRYHQRPTVTRVCAARGGVAYAVAMFRSAPDGEYHVEGQNDAWSDASRLTRLPALWSVVIGQMSLVGPAPWLLSAYADAPTEALARLQTAPGLLRLRAVGLLSRLATTEAEADKRYVTHGSLWMDLEQLAAAALMRRRFFSQGAPEAE